MSSVQHASQLVSHIDHHHLLASAGQGGDLALDGLGQTGVDGTTGPTVGGHANDQMLGRLVLRHFDVSLLVEGQSTSAVHSGCFSCLSARAYLAA